MEGQEEVIKKPAEKEENAKQQETIIGVRTNSDREIPQTTNEGDANKRRKLNNSKLTPKQEEI